MSTDVPGAVTGVAIAAQAHALSAAVGIFDSARRRLIDTACTFADDLAKRIDTDVLLPASIGVQIHKAEGFKLCGACPGEDEPPGFVFTADTLTVAQARALSDHINAGWLRDVAARLENIAAEADNAQVVYAEAMRGMEGAVRRDAFGDNAPHADPAHDVPGAYAKGTSSE